MIYRFMFVGYTDNVQSMKIFVDKRHYVALSYHKNKVYMYVESNDEMVDPACLAQGDLIAYPNGAKWERAVEIFHYSKPISREQWKRKLEKKTPHVMLNQLKPEKISSYIFYHYQYQEEYPGDGDRYGVIYLHGEQIIFYLEDPTENETEVIEGGLNTRNSPVGPGQWNALMAEHFVDQWRGIKNMEWSDYIEY